MPKPPHSQRNGARHLAEVVADALSPALAAQGFAGREVIARWDDLVGPRLAPRTRPLRIDWPKRRPGGVGDASEPATLVVLVESAFAPEMQHAGPLVTQRVNALLGWAAVGRVSLRQGPVATSLPREPASRPVSDRERQAVLTAAAALATPDLRDAVARLGLAIHQRRKTPP